MERKHLDILFLAGQNIKLIQFPTDCEYYIKRQSGCDEGLWLSVYHSVTFIICFNWFAAIKMQQKLLTVWHFFCVDVIK